MTRTKPWRMALVGLALGLAACTQGFTPLYGESAGGTSARAALNSISVPPIGDDRVGQQLRKELIGRLNPSGEPANARYRLSVQTSDQLTDLLVQQNTTVLRRNFTLIAYYELLDTVEGEVVYQGNAQRAASLNRLDSEYANVIALRDAQERAASALADAVAQRLGVVMATLGSPEGRRKTALRKAATPTASPVPMPGPARNPALPPEADDAPPLGPPPARTFETNTGGTEGVVQDGSVGDASGPAAADTGAGPRFPAPEAIDPADL